MNNMIVNDEHTLSTLHELKVVFPIIELLLKESINEEELYNDKYKINFNTENLLLPDEEIVKKIKILLNAINLVGKPGNKIINIIVFKILSDNFNFVQRQSKFKITVLKKIDEYKLLNNDVISKLKEITYNEDFLNIVKKKINSSNIDSNTSKVNNINTDDIIKENIIDKLFNDNFEQFNIEINEEDKNIICTNHCLLNNLDNNKVLNFKLIHNYNINMFYKAINFVINQKDLKKEEIILTLFEIFLNNIELVNQNKTLKKNTLNFIFELVTKNFSDYDKYKKYTFDRNPLITINSLLKFYLE
jgi:hypothetical protein